MKVPGYESADLRQECELAALTAPPGLERVARARRLIDLLRRATPGPRGTQAALNYAAELEPWDHPAVTDDARLEARELRERLVALPPIYARPLVLLAAGYSYDEIAEREGIPRKRVDNRLVEARLRLRGRPGW